MLESWISQQSDMVALALVILGAILALVGILKILGNSISLLIWVFLVIAGFSFVHVGLKQQSAHIPADVVRQLEQFIEPGKALSKDAFRALCNNVLEESPTPSGKPPRDGGGGKPAL